MAECWAGGMELGGGFSLRSFVNSPPLAPASRTPTLRLQSLRRVLGCLGRFAGGGGFHFSICGETHLLILARGKDAEQKTGRVVSCLAPVELATPSKKAGALERLDEELSMHSLIFVVFTDSICICKA